ncbi:HD domain-containing protein [Alphaproteobacteria bacterium]|jgi:predicted HD phosphohydrolase|nr:HD domain-containing protein [Alphaproteobacteria bacterium]
MSKELNSATIIPFLSDIFERRGADEYLGEPVTIGQHMLQSAHFASQDGHDEIVITAALLHDIGHFTGEFIGKPLAAGTVFMADETDRQHERAGAAVLAPFFPELVVNCCRYHVAAKRYLCAREEGYFDKLSEASVHSLNLQGGPMDDAEAAEFEAHPHFKAIIAVRRYDEASKETDLQVPEFRTYIPMLNKIVAAA